METIKWFMFAEELLLWCSIPPTPTTDPAIGLPPAFDPLMPLLCIMAFRRYWSPPFELPMVPKPAEAPSWPKDTLVAVVDPEPGKPFTFLVPAGPTEICFFFVRSSYKN